GRALQEIDDVIAAGEDLGLAANQQDAYFVVLVGVLERFGERRVHRARKRVALLGAADLDRESAVGRIGVDLAVHRHLPRTRPPGLRGTSCRDCAAARGAARWSAIPSGRSSAPQRACRAENPRLPFPWPLARPPPGAATATLRACAR